MSQDQMQAIMVRLAALEAENAALRAAAQSKLTIKVSKNGAVSVYGLQRWPVTLYAGQWGRLLEQAAQIKAFIVANKAQLASKEGTEPEAVPSLAEWRAGQEAAGRAS